MGDGAALSAAITQEERCGSGSVEGGDGRPPPAEQPVAATPATRAPPASSATSGARGQVGRRGREGMCVGQGPATTNGLPPSRALRLAAAF